MKVTQTFTAGEATKSRDAAAEAGCRRVLGCEPGDTRACQLLGQALHRAGRAEEAVAWLRRSVQLDPASKRKRGHKPFRWRRDRL